MEFRRQATPRRTRLDEAVLARGLAPSRSAARGLIMAGRVLVNGVLADKAGTPVPDEADIQVKPGPRFVSRAGEKLANALDAFPVAVRGRHALDVGASTGGFVDCLLQHGAARVIALDVGKGQLDYGLRQEERVFVLEGVNARYLRPQDLPFSPDLLTVDVSFISLAKLLPAVTACMAPVFDALLLVKPQFEAGPERVGKGGIVRNPAVHREVLLAVAGSLSGLGLEVWGCADSGLPGAGGNREFFFWAGRGGAEGLSPATLAQLIDRVVEGQHGAG